MTHQQLLAELKRLDLTEAEALTLLSDANVISDHCVRIWDIAQPDLDRAIQWFKVRRVHYGSATDINEKCIVL